MKLWQWNCRSIRTKRTNLQELTKQEQPDIIAIQETYQTNLRIQGYDTHTGSQRTAILTKKNLTTQDHTIQGTTVEHTLVEVLPEKKTHQSLYVLCLYSPPRDPLSDFVKFITEARRLSKGHKLVIMGDFNAPHTAWGYQHTTKKGARVHDSAQQNHLTLWNDPKLKTRIGNSVSRDTNPDLTFTIGISKAE